MQKLYRPRPFYFNETFSDDDSDDDDNDSFDGDGDGGQGQDKDTGSSEDGDIEEEDPNAVQQSHLGLNPAQRILRNMEDHFYPNRRDPSPPLFRPVPVVAQPPRQPSPPPPPETTVLRRSGRVRQRPKRYCDENF